MKNEIRLRHIKIKGVDLTRSGRRLTNLVKMKQSIKILIALMLWQEF